MTDPEVPTGVASVDPEGFDAFISYSRKDTAFAARLERALERFRPPPATGLPSRRLRVFRDEDDLVGGSYGSSIDRALESSRTLIVICSPDARASEWVDDEIRRFAEARGAEHIVPVLLRGRPNNEPGPEEEAAFPEALVETLGIPLATSFLGAEQVRDPRKGAFAASWYTLLASVLATTRETIEERDRRRLRARRRAVVAGTLALVASLSALSLWALRERGRAIEQATVAEANELAARAALALDRDDDHTHGFAFAAAALELDPDHPTARTLLLRSWYEGDLLRYRGRFYARPFRADTFASVVRDRWSDDSFWLAYEVGSDPTTAYFGTAAPASGLRGEHEPGRGYVVRDAPGEEVAVIPGNWGMGDFTPGGQYLVLAGAGGEGLALVEVPEPALESNFGFDPGPTVLLRLPMEGDRAEFSSDGRTVLAGSEFGAMGAWRLQGHPVPVVPVVIPNGATAWVNPDVSHMIVAGDTVRIWTDTSGVRRFPAHVSAVSADGERVIRTSGDTLIMTDGSGREIARGPVARPLRSLRFVPGGRGVATWDGGEAILWNDDLSESRRRSISAAEGASLAAVGRDGVVLASPDSLALEGWSGERRWSVPGRLLEGAVARDGSRAVVVSGEDSLSVVNLETGGIVGRKRVSTAIALLGTAWTDAEQVGASVDRVRISGDGAIVMAAEDDRYTILWHVDDDRVALPSHPAWVGPGDFAGDYLVAPYGRQVLLHDRYGNPAFQIGVPAASDVRVRWIGEGRALALDTGGDGTLVLSFDAEHLMAGARADGDTLMTAERTTAVPEAPRTELPFGGATLMERLSYCAPLGQLPWTAGCLFDAVGLDAVEAVAGMPVFLRGPHGPSGRDPASREHGWYNPDFVRWATETLIPEPEETGLVRAMGILWEWELSELATNLILGRKLLEHRPELNAEILATYPGHADPGAYLQERLSPASQEVADRLEDRSEGQYDGPFDPTEWLTPSAGDLALAAGFWVRRTVDGTADEFEEGLRRLLAVQDPDLLRAVDALGPGVWGPLVAGADADEALPAPAPETFWEPLGETPPCTGDEARDWVGGVVTLFCTVLRTGAPTSWVEAAPMPIFLSGPHDGANLDTNAETFGHYNPDFVVWLTESLIPGADEPALRLLAGAAYRPWRHVGRAYWRSLLFLRENPELDAALAANWAEGPLGPTELWYAMEPLQQRTDSWGGDRVAELAIVAAGFWIRRRVDGTRDEFEAALTRLLEAVDPDFLAANGGAT